MHYMYKHTNTSTYMNTCAHTDTHTNKSTHMHIYAQTHINAQKSTAHIVILPFISEYPPGIAKL